MKNHTTLKTAMAKFNNTRVHTNTVELIGYMDELDGSKSRYTSPCILIAPDIAVLPEGYALGVYRVKPSTEIIGQYEDCGFMCDIPIPVDTLADIADLPQGTLSVVLWIYDKKRKAVAV